MRHYVIVHLREPALTMDTQINHGNYNGDIVYATVYHFLSLDFHPM